MRIIDIDVAGVVGAAAALKEELDRILSGLTQRQEELNAAEQRLDRERKEVQSERDKLRQERYSCFIFFCFRLVPSMRAEVANIPCSHAFTTRPHIGSETTKKNKKMRVQQNNAVYISQPAL